MRVVLRIFWVVALLVFLSATSGCATSKLRSTVEELGRPGTGLKSDSGQRINGYMLSGGSRVDYKGWVRIAGQDSLKFWQRELVEELSDLNYREWIPVAGPVFPLSSVEALDVYSQNTEDTVGLILVGGVAVFAVLVATADMKPVN